MDEPTWSKDKEEDRDRSQWPDGNPHQGPWQKGLGNLIWTEQRGKRGHSDPSQRTDEALSGTGDPGNDTDDTGACRKSSGHWQATPERREQDRRIAEKPARGDKKKAREVGLIQEEIDGLMSRPIGLPPTGLYGHINL